MHAGDECQHLPLPNPVNIRLLYANASGLGRGLTRQIMSETEPTSTDLVERIIAGDRLAEEELVRLYRRGILVIVRKVIGNCNPSVEDLSQETLALAITKIRGGEVRQPESLSGYIAALARNLAIAHLRKYSHEEGPEEVEAVDSAASPLAVLISKERETAVRAVLKELKPVRDREILYRFYIAEERKEEICRDLGLSSLHFNRVLYRARERFRETYRNKKR